MKEQEFRKRQILSRDETLLIFNAFIDKFRDSFLSAYEDFDYDLISMIEAFGMGFQEHQMVSHCIRVASKDVGLEERGNEEMMYLAKALINDPDMGGLSYEKISNLSKIIDETEELQGKTNGKGH